MWFDVASPPVELFSSMAEKCFCCTQRLATRDTLCVVCDEYQDKDLLWECVAGHKALISFPLAERDIWACPWCESYVRWHPANSEARAVRDLVSNIHMVVFYADYPRNPTGETPQEHFYAHYQQCARNPTNQEAVEAIIKLAALLGIPANWDELADQGP